MEKLVDRFHNIGCFSSFTYLTAENCAKEAKKIAIEFAKYYIGNGIELGYEGGPRYADPEWLFTKFIEEYEN